MDLHLLEERTGSVHIYELVDDDLIHVDSLNTRSINRRVNEYLEECGTDRGDVKTSEFVEKSQVLDIIATVVDAFGINEDTQQDIIKEVEGYLTLPE